MISSSSAFAFAGGHRHYVALVRFSHSRRVDEAAVEGGMGSRSLQARGDRVRVEARSSRSAERNSIGMPAASSNARRAALGFAHNWSRHALTLNQIILTARRRSAAFRQDTMAEIENKRTVREGSKNCIDRTIQGCTAGKQSALATHSINEGSAESEVAQARLGSREYRSEVIGAPQYFRTSPAERMTNW
jgi:hypothetical protein